MNWKREYTLTQALTRKNTNISLYFYGRRLLGVILLFLVAGNILFLASQLISGYYNYGAESVTISQILRVSRSEPYISSIPDIPLMISSFTPLLFWLLEPLVKILSLDNVAQIATLGRIYIFFIVIACFYLLKQFATEGFADLYDSRSFFVSIFWFTAMFPGAIISIRPDFLSFVFELAGFIYFFRYLFSESRAPSIKDFILSTFFISIGIAAKQNTIGIFIGIILYLLLTKKYKNMMAFGALTLFTTSTIYLLYALVIGSRFGANVMQSLLNRPGLDLQSLLASITNIVQPTFYPYTMFYLLAVAGLLIISKRSPSKALLMATCLGSSFIFATIGQLKPGAWLNYHFGFFLLATVPVSISLNEIFRGTESRKINRSLQIIFAVTIFVNLALGTLGSLKIVANYRFNYPYDAAISYVSKNYPAGLIYTPDEDLALFFHDRVALAPWAEKFIDMTPSMRTSLPAQQALIADSDFSIALKSGRNCASWHPSGDFVDSVSNLTNLRKRFGNICIFDRG